MRKKHWLVASHKRLDWGQGSNRQSRYVLWVGIELAAIQWLLPYRGPSVNHPHVIHGTYPHWPGWNLYNFINHCDPNKFNFKKQIKIVNKIQMINLYLKGEKNQKHLLPIHPRQTLQELRNYEKSTIMTKYFSLVGKYYTFSIIAF